MEKRKLIIYWVATGLMAFGMLQSGIQQIFHTQGMIDIIVHVGYPLYFLNIIGAWKILGVIAILIPRFKLVKEWAYAGLFFAMTGAVASHLAVGDGVKEIIGPFMQTVFIVVSWYFRPANRKIISVNQ
jgi:uncharacterized membrane protein